MGITIKKIIEFYVTMIKLTTKKQRKVDGFV
ncbi:hypothetical protein DEAC_c42140 [Desulfosporosinus acididurans]|uniref:Uncharacterized protein n=1 Tax=Desulfosporosinus acididurans TaxID=476652 RepID=A0A0J1FK44_9FIRM|nr:hypothetical protein DEAC_c42140 [Desulfosporosinus acididurans]